MTSIEKKIKVCISAGEASGDFYAGNLAKEILRNSPNSEVKGMGGKCLREAKGDVVIPLEKYAALNGFNLFKIVSKSIVALYLFFRLLVSFKPNIIVLIDYPGFNFVLLRMAKLFRIPVIYFIPPKVWAWKEARIKVLKKHADFIGLIFPFEEDYYQEKGLTNAKYIGNPLSISLSNPEILSKDEFFKKYDLRENTKKICIMPGSRESEVKRHLSVIAKAINNLKSDDVEILVPKANNVNGAIIKKELGENCKLIENNNLEALKYSDVGLLKSGTCNIEAGFLSLPFCVFYKVPELTAKIIRKFVKLSEYSPINIVKTKTVNEYMQEDFTVENLEQEAKKLLTDENYKNEVKDKLNNSIKLLNTEKNPYKEVTSKVFELAKDSNSVSYLYRLSKYLKNYKKMFISSLLCMVVFGATDGGIPFLVKYILDGVFKDQNKTLLWLMPVFLIVFAIIRGLSELGQQYLLSKVGHNIVKDLRNDAQEKLLSLEPGFFIRNSVGDLLARFTSDILLVRELLTNSIAALIRDSIRIVALLATAFYLDSFLAIIAFFVFPIGIIPVVKFGKKIRNLSKAGQVGIGKLSAIVQETILGNKVVRAFNREKYELDRFKAENESVTRTFIKSERVRALTGPVNEMLAVIVISAIILYGGYSVIGGIRSQGDFIAFLLAVFLLYDPFKKLSKLNNQVQMGISGAERLFTLLDTENNIIEVANPKALENDYSIKFSNISFCYNEKVEPKTLQNISFDVKQNEKCALVGFSGSGKSTLVDLLPRFIDPQEGSIEIGGINIKELSLRELRNHISIVSQHVFLFNDTVFNNIAYGNFNATEEEIIEASKAAYAYDFIKELPNGFHTVVGESGLSLSGGERQRIAIARAILKDAPILILDEATAALDNRAEKEVQAAIETLENGRTSIVIAHRLSTIENADKIIVLDQGKIVEIGNHEELIKKKKAYYDLHRMQFSE